MLFAPGQHHCPLPHQFRLGPLEAEKALDKECLERLGIDRGIANRATRTRSLNLERPGDHDIEGNAVGQGRFCAVIVIYLFMIYLSLTANYALVKLTSIKATFSFHRAFMRNYGDGPMLMSPLLLITPRSRTLTHRSPAFLNSSANLTLI